MLWVLNFLLAWLGMIQSRSPHNLFIYFFFWPISTCITSHFLDRYRVEFGIWPIHLLAFGAPLNKFLSDMFFQKNRLQIFSTVLSPPIWPPLVKKQSSRLLLYISVCEINARQVANGINIPSLSDLLFLPQCHSWRLCMHQAGWDVWRTACVT